MHSTLNIVKKIVRLFSNVSYYPVFHFAWLIIDKNISISLCNVSDLVPYFNLWSMCVHSYCTYIYSCILIFKTNKKSCCVIQEIYFLKFYNTKNKFYFYLTSYVGRASCKCYSYNLIQFNIVFI